MKRQLPTVDAALEIAGSEGSKGSATTSAQKRLKKNAPPVGTQVPTLEGSKGSSWLPPGFVERKSGIFAEDPASDDAKPAWLCSPIEITAQTRNEDGEDWGLLIRVRNPDGGWVEWAMPSSLLAGDGVAYRGELMRLGFRMAGGPRAKTDLHRLLSLTRVTARARCVPKLGWHRGAFMRPEGCVGKEGDDRLVWQTGRAPRDNRIRVQGSLNEWRDGVGRYAIGNSRLALGICAALAAPTLTPLGEEGGALHFRGPSSVGKTTLVRVAGSVCGGGGPQSDYLRNWNSTGNALEVTLAAHNDGLLVLDEIGQADAEAVKRTAYSLSNGTGRARLRETTELRDPLTWSVLALSTGEVTLSQKIGESGRGARAMAGQEIRFLDLEADAGAGLGIFETLHGFASPAALAEHLNANSRQHFGAPLRVFLERLVAEDWRAEAQSIVREIANSLAAAGHDGQVRRAAKRFAVIAAAGELAIKWGILPWPEGEARSSVERVFGDWLSRRGGGGPSEIRNGIAAVGAFIDANGATRFQRYDDAKGEFVRERAGWSRRVDGGTEFLIYPSAFAQILSGHDRALVAREMAARGLLRTNADGKSQKKCRLPDGSERRMYVVAAGAFDDSAFEERNPGTLTEPAEGSESDAVKGTEKQQVSGIGTLGTHGTPENQCLGAHDAAPTWEV